MVSLERCPDFMVMFSIDIAQIVCVWVVVFWCTTAHGSSHDAVSSSSIIPSPSTCPFRTVNYITHSLPQQCLAVPRVNNSTGALGSSVATTGTTDGVILTRDSSTEDVRTTSSPIVPSDTSSTPIKPSVTAATASPSNDIVEELARAVDSLDEDSDLESGNFLSFEEWKKQNLQKAGQSEHVGRRSNVDSQEPRKRPVNVHNSLESLGDDGEIDIDFSGFVPGGPEKPALEASRPISDSPPPGAEAEFLGSPRARSRSKDAGTTCKERFNYASFDCAANVLKTNKEAKSPNTVLVENKDSYMLNQCSASNKFIILELCNDILIDTVVLANFEFFSSTFRTFRVSVSDRYPVKLEKWKTLGTYEARNTRGVQAFLVENPLIWTRYLRIEFLTHYGNEFYCPVSLVRIHGTTMMEDYKHDLEQAQEDDEEDSEPLPNNEVPIDSLTPEAVAEALQTSTVVENDASSIQVLDEDDVDRIKGNALQSIHDSFPDGFLVPASVAAMEAIASVIEQSDTCSLSESLAETHPREIAALQSSSFQTRDPSPALSAATPQITSPVGSSQNIPVTDKNTTTKIPVSESKVNVTTTKSINNESSRRSNAQSSNSTSITESNTIANSMSTPKSKSSAYTSAPDRPKPSSATTQAHAAVPTMQESFFKSVQKRLQMLEANSSLSLQYIEDQSRALRDAFKKVEQRQLSRTNTFLEQLNQTVLNELREFRQQYDQLWQSTVIELEMQRERYERDNEAINARIGILADEVIFQRRMAIMQMVLILVCLVLVLFSRGAINNYLELPIVQNVLARSPSTRWLNLSTDSLIRPTQPTRIRSAHQLRTERTGILKGHRRMQSEDSITDIQSGNEVFAPPTPVSDYGQSEVELIPDQAKSPAFESDKDETAFGDPEFDPDSIERPATSPPTLRVNDGSPILSSDVAETSEEDTLVADVQARLNSLPNGESTNVSTLKDIAPKRLSWKLPDS